MEQLTFGERLCLLAKIANIEEFYQLTNLALRLEAMICYDDIWSYIKQGEFED